MNSLVSPFFADFMLWLMYAVTALAVVATAFSVWRGVRVREPSVGYKGHRIGWLVALGVVLCLAITFLFGSTDMVVTNGQPFTDTFWLKLTDMFIFTSLLLIIGCFVSAIVSRFRS